MLESIAQLGAYLLLSTDEYKSFLPLFGGIDRARFRRQVLPDETLQVNIEMTRLSARAGKGKGSASVSSEAGPELACEAELMFVLAPN